MSKFPELAVVFTCCLFAASSALSQPLGLGRPALPAEIAAWNTDVRADGQGLPAGSGNVRQGEEIFAEKCAACHGDFGEGVGRWPVLAGGQDTLEDARPIKTLVSYWPYLSTAWDYIYRTMPFGDAASLSPDETYALVAYLLYLNDFVDEDSFELTDQNLALTHLPNEGGFKFDDRVSVEFSLFRDDCMRACKDTVKITARAPKTGVTPTDQAD
jgi:cytochrome c